MIKTRKRAFGLSGAVALAALALGFSSPSWAADAGGHPDLSGVWAMFWHDHPGGRFGAPIDPKLSAKGQKVVDDFAATHDLDKYDPGAYCVPAGMPTEMFGLGGYYYEIIQQPKQITVLVENDMQVRRIHTDRRTPPPDYPHTRGGYSVAHWDGDTLVVDTSLIKAWPTERWPHSDNTHVIERITLRKATNADLKLQPGLTEKRLGDTVMVDKLTMTDPDMYDAPQSVTLFFRHADGNNMLEYDCPEGNWWDLMESVGKKG